MDYANLNEFTDAKLGKITREIELESHDFYKTEIEDGRSGPKSIFGVDDLKGGWADGNERPKLVRLVGQT